MREARVTGGGILVRDSASKKLLTAKFAKEVRKGSKERLRSDYEVLGKRPLRGNA
jgi:hypothetical protein